jgi:hypothetical protein
VRGHKKLTAMPLAWNSSAIRSVHMLVPHFEIVYATCGPNQFGCMFRRGQSVRLCGFPAFIKSGMASLEHRYVARTLTPHIKSKCCAVDSSVPARRIALALLIYKSMPPNVLTVSSMASLTHSSKRTSTTQASARPAAAVISSAAG